MPESPTTWNHEAFVRFARLWIDAEEDRTRGDLEEALGISRTTYHGLTKPGANPTLRVTTAAIRLFGVTLPDLTDLEDPSE